MSSYSGISSTKPEKSKVTSPNAACQLMNANSEKVGNIGFKETNGDTALGSLIPQPKQNKTNKQTSGENRASSQ